MHTHTLSVTAWVLAIVIIATPIALSVVMSLVIKSDAPGSDVSRWEENK